MENHVMCLASCSLTQPKSPVFTPIVIGPNSAPPEITDDLVTAANYLLEDAPPAVRQLVFDMLKMENTPTAVIPFLSVAYFMGRKEEHADAVRMLIGMSTLAVVRP